MRVLFISLAFVSVFLVACKPSIPTKDGSVTINDSDGGSVSISGPNGEVKIDGTEGNMSIKDDKGTEISAGTNVSDAALGVAVYPGAKKIEAGGMSVKDGDTTMTSFAYETGDSVAQVGAFYERELPTSTTSATTADGSEMQMLNLDEPKRKIIIIIVRDKGKTVTMFTIRSEIKN